MILKFEGGEKPPTTGEMMGRAEREERREEGALCRSLDAGTIGAVAGR